MSAIRFRKRLTKLKITISLPKKFGSKGFMAAVKVTKILRSWRPNMRYAIQKREIDYINIVPFIINFGGKVFE